jgi:hypothetical protein
MRAARISIVIIVLGMASSGCAAFGSGAAAPLATSLNELMPHNDRDHFVYVWQRVASGKRLAEGIIVEHITRDAESDEFEIVVSENGVPAGRLLMRDDGQELALIDEDDIQQQIRMSFVPPLTQYEIPLVAGVRQQHSIANLTSLVNQTPITTVEVSQVVRMASAKDVSSAVGNYERGIGIEVERTLHWSWGDAAYESRMMFIPGIGEIRSEARAGEGLIIRRELACAIINGRSIGDCGAVEDRLQELRDAGPTDNP